MYVGGGGPIEWKTVKVPDTVRVSDMRMESAPASVKEGALPPPEAQSLRAAPLAAFSNPNSSVLEGYGSLGKRMSTLLQDTSMGYGK